MIKPAAICHHCGNLTEINVEGWFLKHTYNGHVDGKQCEGSYTKYYEPIESTESTESTKAAMTESIESSLPNSIAQEPAIGLPANWRQSATVVMPNDTKLTIEGDGEIIQQVLNRLNGLELKWQAK